MVVVCLVVAGRWMWDYNLKAQDQTGEQVREEDEQQPEQRQYSSFQLKKLKNIVRTKITVTLWVILDQRTDKQGAAVWDSNQIVPHHRDGGTCSSTLLMTPPVKASPVFKPQTLQVNNLFSSRWWGRCDLGQMLTSKTEEVKGHVCFVAHMQPFFTGYIELGDNKKRWRLSIEYLWVFDVDIPKMWPLLNSALHHKEINNNVSL